jgi:hypothetical protein
MLGLETAHVGGAQVSDQYIAAFVRHQGLTLVNGWAEPGPCFLLQSPRHHGRFSWAPSGGLNGGFSLGFVVVGVET